MEDARRSHSNYSTPVEGVGSIEARFTDFCENATSMDEGATEETMALLRETKHILSANTSAFGNGTMEEVEKYWFACILFCVRRLSNKDANNVSHGNSEHGFTLCWILKKVMLNFTDFFKKLPQFLDKVGPTLSKLYGTDWEKKLGVKEFQTNFEHMSILSVSYNRAYQKLFLTKEANVDQSSAVVNGSGCLSDFHQFGWFLFLALRFHVFGPFKTLVTCTNGLASIFAILIIHIPGHLRNFSFDDSTLFVKKGNKVDLIASLCNIYETSEGELRKTIEQVNNLIIYLLQKKYSLASECKTANLENVDTEGLIYFDDLMEDSSLSSSLSILGKDYEDAMRNEGELDERLFISEGDCLFGSESLSGGTLDLKSSKEKLDFVASPMKTNKNDSAFVSHSNGNCCAVERIMVATPVRATMTAGKWLRSVITPFSAKPSAELERLFSLCDRDITSDVMQRARIIIKAIFPSSGCGENCTPRSLRSTNFMHDTWAEKRRLEALKLYYRVLEAMCKAEVQTSHARNLTSLLNNERFHRCMIACSVELVLATYKTITMLFPTVLERIGITSFDLSKVIEIFIRHEETLPRELRRHLNSLEERLLESMVWKKGSSMYNCLATARPPLFAEINLLGLLAEPMLSLDAIAMHIGLSSGGSPPERPFQKRVVSPGKNGDAQSPKRACSEYRSVLVERNSFTSTVKDRFLMLNSLKSKLSPAALQSASYSPTRPNSVGGGETCAEASISLFFGKIVKLAAVRIKGMVERLQVSQNMRENAYHLFQKILNQRTALFFNRHIDQIILCCFYGVAKVFEVKLSFREIIYNYRKQPHCEPQVFRSVFVDWSSVCHNQKTGHEHVDIITFYNEIFIPSVKLLLEELVPTAAQETSQVPDPNNNNYGHCPISPKASPFPSLPDMSPKKISATHNVYVSPLRATKMDALISHSAKSYYACVGERTHAYQSPSKDLTDINDRLNRTRRLRRPLDLDVDVGLVSDTVVANSLYFQTGSCVASARAPIKSEQPNL